MHAAFDQLRSYARSRNERPSKMARQIIEADRADLVAPAVGRTTAQQR